MSLVLIPDGPGTTIILRDGFQGLPSAPRGTSSPMGQYASGPVTHAALAISPGQARLISGEPDDDFEASLCLDDIYSLNTPPVLIARITDGNEIQAQASLWDRNPDRSYIRNNPLLIADRAPLATVKANNGGRWGGRKRVSVGIVNAIATDLTSTTLDISTAPQTGTVFLVNLYAKALLYVEGDSSSPYTVDSNDAAGVVTIEGEFSQAAQDADGTGAIDGSFRLVLEHAKELSAVIPQDSITQQRFALNGLRRFNVGDDWEVVTSYANLGLSVSDSLPWISTVAETELTRYQLELTSSYVGATVENKMPSNFCEVPTDVTGNTITYQWFRWSADSSNTGDPFLFDAAPNDTGSIEPHVYDITFTAATVFTVAVTWPDGSAQTLSTAGATGAEFDPGHPQLAKFTILVGGTPAISGDTMKIRIDPLPADLSKREAFVYPIAVSVDGDTNQRLRIVSNTYNTLSLRSDLVMSDFGAAAGTAATVSGSVDLSAVSLTNETFIIGVDGLSEITLTSTGSGPGAAAIAVELNSLDTANLFTFGADPDDTTLLKITANGSYGAKAKITFGNGTGHSIVGIPTTGETAGTDATPFRIEARWPMWGGYDGIAPTASQYIIALDLSDNIFKRWLSTNLGLVRFGAPSITDAATKGAGRALAAKHGWKFIPEFDSALEAVSLPGEAAIADMLANEEESDYVDHFFPSRAKFLNVGRTKSVVRSHMGMFMGLKARMANVGVDGEKGFHIAAANNNEQGKISPRVIGLSDDIGRWTPPIGLLNDHGIVPVLWEGASVFYFGNRMFSQGRTKAGKRFTITERDVFYHVSRDLFVTTRPVIFKSISARRLSDIQLKLREKMKTYHADGWFSDFGGTRPGFEQQVSVEVPLSLNTPALLQEGKVSASIVFRPRPALEDLTIIISPTQLTSEG